MRRRSRRRRRSGSIDGDVFMGHSNLTESRCGRLRAAARFARYRQMGNFGPAGSIFSLPPARSLSAAASSTAYLKREGGCVCAGT